MALARSLSFRLGLVVLAFALVPWILWGEFSKAQTINRQIVLDRLEVEAELVAKALQFGLDDIIGPNALETNKVLESLELDRFGIQIRLLLRPQMPEGLGPVFLIGAVPSLGPDDAESERKRMAEAGIIAAIPEKCEGAHAFDLHFKGRKNREEMLTALVPFATAAGCWTIVVSQDLSGPTGSLLGQPYWQSPEVQMAGAVYALLALLVFLVLGLVVKNLWRFGRQARAVGRGLDLPKPFVKVNHIPELDGVARELDQMVHSLKQTAEEFRYAAEDNAHAFKTPIATIAQSLEPLRRTADERASRSLQVIESCLDRLDALVAASRRLDQVNADLVNPPRDLVDVSKLIHAVLDSYDDMALDQRVRIQRRISPKGLVRASTDLIETVVENIVENALSFSPEGGVVQVSVSISGKKVRLIVADQGPGASPEILEGMFNRYMSHRPNADPSGAAHFGIGLWIVERNVTSVGGTVMAENRPEGGLQVVVSFPLA